MSRPADGWQDRAFCQYLATRPELDLDLTVWFPRGGGPHQWDRAREFCAECVVRAECLEYALANEIEHFRYGMWGGTTPRERSRIARTRAAVTA